MTKCLGWLLGFQRLRSLDSIDVTLAASWANEHWWTVFGACVVAIGGTFAFYRRYENCKSKTLRTTLSVVRAMMLCLVLVTLAAPVIHSSATVLRSPLVYVIFDDSESMGHVDTPGSGTIPLSRTQEVLRLFGNTGSNLLEQLEQSRDCRIETLRVTDDKAVSLMKIDRHALESALTSSGRATPLLAALAAIPKHARSERVAAAIVLSDFIDTTDAGFSEELKVAVRSADVPIYTIGVGSTSITDVAVLIRSEAKVRLGKPTTVTVELQHSGLDGEAVSVSLQSRSLQFVAEAASQGPRTVDERTVTLDATTVKYTVSYEPESSGQIELIATVSPLSGEAIRDNNVATQQIGVIEDFLRVDYVDFEPNWEWRFIKEVFARDDLVGRDGFRTFLASSSANVRLENELFHTELALPRSEFYVNDVLFIGDGPREMFTPEFCDFAEEFVRNFGGGLVVIAGPRFGPQELADTPLGKMLPVRSDTPGHQRDDGEFTLQLTTEATLYPFMRLAESEAENLAAWKNLGTLSWYQPVNGVHEQTQVLAEHPTDVCDDGVTNQPLIAIRPYGKGQVVYLGFNEMWRIRKRYGDRYYQRFWSQVTHRLGMSHAVGAEKRFVAEFDRPAYNVGDEAIFSVEAFNDDYEPLGLSQLSDGSLIGELTMPNASGVETCKVSIPTTRPGQFEMPIRFEYAGRYTLRVADPVGGQIYERNCQVSEPAIERRQVIRDAELQKQLASTTGGRSYDLSGVDHMVREIALGPTLEREQRQVALWCTPAWFLLIVGLMLCEWTVRKLAYLR